LASEVMLFGALFTSYIVLRSGSAHWEHGWKVLNIPMATLNTFILITSSVTMVMSYAAVLQRNQARFKSYMLATILLGTGFLVVKAFEYGAKFSHHHYPSTDLFYATYFTLTGLHVLHVIIGIGVNLWFYAIASKQWDDPLFPGRVEASGLYWHFVDLVWIFLFPTLYLL